jgi:hypothetical protein
MSLNVNPWCTQLLSWHGHDRGGVRVPFRPSNRPLQSIIETALIQRLRTLAGGLSRGQVDLPRWVFLVGGPGNGKSETVEDFLTVLDQELGASGRLIGHLSQSFAAGQLLQRRVEVLPGNIAPQDATFRAAIGRLIVIQDATATEDPQGDAARTLARDLVDLYTTSETPPPFLIVCANRGLLARAINEASKEYGAGNDITKLLGEIIRASGLGIEALSRERKPCWPLADYPFAACWPLDLDSLLESNSSAPSPMSQALGVASNLPQWEVAGRCLDCDARENCPLRQNAAWFREPNRASSLVHILRRGELSTGQRWNFRGLFSLIAELSVGQWQDFEESASPCEWVHARMAALANDAIPEAVDAAYWLTRRLYPHALFATTQLDEVARKLQGNVTGSQPRSQRIMALQTAPLTGSTKHVREYLTAQYASLDPAISTPISGGHVLRAIENDYSQSVELGNADARTANLAGVERNLLWFVERAEAEWDRMGRASLQATSVSHLLRRFAAILVKRSIGVARGHHANEEFLDEYSLSLRDRPRLNRLTSGLQSLLGTANFQFDIVETFGQPQPERTAELRLIGPQAGLRAEPAPTSTAARPGHDVPCFEITDTKYRIPITFDLFLALRLRQAGCASSSLPASVRASIDRVRHRYAGTLCRATDKFLDQTASIEIAGKARLVLTDVSEPLTLEPL